MKQLLLLIYALGVIASYFCCSLDPEKGAKRSMREQRVDEHILFILLSTVGSWVMFIIALCVHIYYINNKKHWTNEREERVD